VKLTDEQKAAVARDGHACVVSCPGSGKTRTVVAKLLRCIEEVRGSTRSIACITHTNAGADEIDSRLRETCFSGEDEYYQVATIHSFALNDILRPYHDRLPEFWAGFEILASDDERYKEKRQELSRTFGVDRSSGDQFESIQRAPDGSILVPQGIPNSVGAEWCAWLDVNAFVSLSDIVYHSCRLLRHHSFIASSVASRYAWMLIDEFQDSSPSQVFILKAVLALGRTKFFCVADPNQSIYGFAGARPGLLTDFASLLGIEEPDRLNGNFRSSSRIIGLARSLCPATVGMTAVGKYANYETHPSHHTVASPLDGILEIFLPAAEACGIEYGQIAVLAPTWWTLFPIAQGMRGAGYPVIGPGARPYKRDNPFSQIAEALGAYLEGGEPEIAHSVQRALFVTLTNLQGESCRRVFSYAGRIAVCRVLNEAAAVRLATSDAREWLSRAAPKLAEILLDAELLFPPHKQVLIDAASAMVEEIDRKVGDQPLAVEDLGIFARPKSCIHLMTIHKAKGREFGAVAVIDMHDGRLPFYKIAQITDPELRQEQYEEARRVAYVAITRAERLLMLFTDRTDHRNRPSPFLYDMGLLRTTMVAQNRR
jgi:DNA helicase-2/ATP-dependent DNA helicase PcrA